MDFHVNLSVDEIKAHLYALSAGWAKSVFGQFPCPAKKCEVNLMMPNPTMDQLAVSAVRVLAIEGVQKAKSGHPGLPLGSAPMAYELWAAHMKHNPADPNWINRDRFVLSAGHASMLLYSLLYLFGYGLTLDDLKSFRQWDSRTPGHPELHDTPGVEMTTGPLGQGMATAVGMAMAEAHLGARFNREGYPVKIGRAHV